MQSLLDRFCRYVVIDTEANEKSTTYPSSPGQLVLGKLLADELRAMGAQDVEHDAHGIVWATLPANVPHAAPAIAFIAHLDTSPETTGKNVKPVVHTNYSGEDIVLPGDKTKVLKVADAPELAGLKGKTLITTDGTTLLGADDKAGIAVIMETVQHLIANPVVPRGPVRICFTCDEEIGHGVDHVDLKKLGAVVGYTLDGGGVGEIDTETFSADLAIVTVTGVNIHPGIAKGAMVNAVRLAAEFVARLPSKELSPETTADRQGFLHPYRIEGGVASATIRILLRGFTTDELVAHARRLGEISKELQLEHPRAAIDVKVTPQYRNMAEGLAKEPRSVVLAEEAMRHLNIVPRRTIVRGGTDGSRLTEIGLPTPNLSTGEHQIHSPLEFTCLEEMATAVKVCVELVKLWSREKI